MCGNGMKGKISRKRHAKKFNILSSTFFTYLVNYPKQKPIPEEAMQNKPTPLNVPKKDFVKLANEVREMEESSLEKLLIEHFGKRCKTKDTDDFPDLKGKKKGRCLTCEVWEAFDNNDRNTRLDELKTMYNATQPDTIPQGADTTEEAEYMKKRIKELENE